MVPPSARSAQGGTRQQTTARRHRGLLPIGSAQQQAVLPASTSQLHHLQALCGCVSSPPSAEHRSSLSGRGPLTERPSTRISHRRAVPATGSAGPGRWPASHDPPIALSRDFFFRKSSFEETRYTGRSGGEWARSEERPSLLLGPGREERDPHPPLLHSYLRALVR